MRKGKSLFLGDVAVGRLSMLQGLPPHAGTCKAALFGLNFQKKADDKER